MKPGFQCDNLLVESDDGRHVRLAREVVFVRRDGLSITIPVGSEADGASTPRFLWRVLPPFGNYWMSAVLHDYLYRRSAFPKEFCDETFHEAMLDEPVRPWLAKIIYLGVAWFGGPSFREARAKQSV